LQSARFLLHGKAYREFRRGSAGHATETL